MGAQELPGARPGDQNRRQIASGNNKREFLACGSVVKPCRSNFSSNFENLAPSKSDDVNARNTLFDVGVRERQSVNKTVKVDAEIEPKSMKIDARGAPDAFFC